VKTTSWRSQSTSKQTGPKYPAEGYVLAGGDPAVTIIPPLNRARPRDLHRLNTHALSTLTTNNCTRFNAFGQGKLANPRHGRIHAPSESTLQANPGLNGRIYVPSESTLQANPRLNGRIHVPSESTLQQANPRPHSSDQPGESTPQQANPRPPQVNPDSKQTNPRLLQHCFHTVFTAA